MILQEDIINPMVYSCTQLVLLRYLDTTFPLSLIEYLPQKS